ncbi:hypothetical protein VKT23_020646 [Stygiomarasmius scandens]|uniref:F-box domain-containing protein n=1 Tax=Marasmiellus scandens TaxID=2682957 RepID=A0ABR1IIL0_9AGAR
MGSLPQELVDQILDHLAGEQHALRQTSTVCKRLRPHSQALLFSTIKLYHQFDKERSHKFHHLLEFSPRIALLVKSLLVLGGLSDPIDLDSSSELELEAPLPLILDKLIRLQRLEVVFNPIFTLDSIRCFARMLQSVSGTQTTLELSDGALSDSDQSSSSLLNLLKSSLNPELKYVVIRLAYVEWGLTPASESTHPSTRVFQLTSLRLHDRLPLDNAIVKAMSINSLTHLRRLECTLTLSEDMNRFLKSLTFLEHLTLRVAEKRTIPDQADTEFVSSLPRLACLDVRWVVHCDYSVINRRYSGTIFDFTMTCAAHIIDASSSSPSLQELVLRFRWRYSPSNYPPDPTKLFLSNRWMAFDDLSSRTEGRLTPIIVFSFENVARYGPSMQDNICTEARRALHKTHGQGRLKVLFGNSFP